MAYSYDPDSWTPAQGWAMAIRRTVLRLMIGGAVQGILFWILCPWTSQLAILGPMVSMMFVVTGLGALLGFLLIGVPICYKADEKTGLAGRSLFLPLVGLMLVGIALAAGPALLVFFPPNLYFFLLTTGAASGCLLSGLFFLAMQ